MVPFLTKAQVISQSPPNAVFIMFMSGQMPSYPVQVLIHGPADPLRVNQVSLPAPGTWGMVAFHAGDVRNGVWLGSYYGQNNQAFSDTTDANYEYNSHYSGFYTTLDKTGNKVISFPDGTNIVIGDGITTPPAMYRQTVNPAQEQEAVPFTDAQRVINKPSPFTLTVNHPTGASLQITPSGAINVNAATGETVNFSQGGANVTDALVLVSKMVSEFNNHVHPDPQGGDTGPPATQLTAANIESTVTKTSS